MTTLATKLRNAAKTTGLDGIVELLNEAALAVTMVEGLQAEVTTLRAAIDALRVSPVQGETKIKPWYPDDTGAWIEVPDDWMKRPLGLKKRARINVLLHCERKQESYTHSVNLVCDCDWDHGPTEDLRIVAFKIAEKDAR